MSADGCSIIFLPIKSVQLVISFPIVSLHKPAWWLSPSSNLRAFIKMSASQNVSWLPLQPCSGQKTKIWSWREERQICKEMGTGGWRGWCDPGFFSIIINFVFSYKLATSVWLESLSKWKTDLEICSKQCLCGGWLRWGLMELSTAAAAASTPPVSHWPEWLPLAEIALQLLSRVSSWLFLHFPGLSWKLNNPLKM